VTDDYSKLAEDVEFRKEVAEKLGLGFEVPAHGEVLMRPTRPKITAERPIEVAA
jgi:hypothetical protein